MKKILILFLLVLVVGCSPETPPPFHGNSGNNSAFVPYTGADKEININNQTLVIGGKIQYPENITNEINGVTQHVDYNGTHIITWYD